MRWVDLENYHVTLKCLGEVRPEALPPQRPSPEKPLLDSRILQAQSCRFES
ncbi:MAG: hypothetical protein IH789_12860 [Acidobacteria bacterium]|nr:hypothetical protein [Acidobacteriota bacterium]